MSEKFTYQLSMVEPEICIDNCSIVETVVYNGMLKKMSIYIVLPED